MKKIRLLVLIIFGFAQVRSAAQDYSKMSATELNEAFVIAVKKCSSDEVQKLIQAGADVTTPITYSWTEGDMDRDVASTALIYAVRHNRPTMVKVLLKEERMLNQALDIAIRKGYSEVVEELIKGGADINYLNEYNDDTPLITAIKYGHGAFTSRSCQTRKIIQALLKAGAHVNHSNKHGETALMVAVREHDFDTVQNLLQIPEVTTSSWFGFGTKPINYADKEGNTALLLAIKYVRNSYFDNHGYNICVNSQKILKALLETPGIDPHHVNKQGDTAIKLLKELDEEMKRGHYYF